MSADKVAANHFYQDNGDKIKQNWLLYEYANVLYSAIGGSPKLAAYRKRHSEGDIAAFCVYFAKRLRQSLFNAKDKPSSGFVIDVRYVCEFYPDISPVQAKRLLEVTFEAWKEHVQACLHCPNQCLTEPFEITGMFDHLEKTGWPAT
jgi:hypothetical protein